MDKSGPAFACASEHGHQQGMTLRQWYAGQALQGMLSRLQADGSHECEAIAEMAFTIADAMLEAEKADG